MSSIVVVRGDRPVGLLMNYNLDRRLGTKYGVSLYYNRPVDTLMDTAPLVVDAEQAIEEVAGAAMQRANDKSTTTSWSWSAAACWARFGAEDARHADARADRAGQGLPTR
jgi:CBS domain-containing protein